MDDRGLYELFLALFGSETELQRFLVLEELLPSKLLPPSGTRSLQQIAYQAASILEDEGLVNEALFAALERRSPERRNDIREVARRYAVGVAEPPPATDGTGPPPPAAGGPSPELAGFAEQLQADLEVSEAPPDLPARAMDPDHWPWTAAAAVLGSFRPSLLRPLAGSDPGSSAVVALADLVFPGFDGSWVPQREVRMPCLQRLWAEGEFTRALDSNDQLPDPHRDMIRKLLAGWEPVLASLDTRALETIDVVASWLEPVLGEHLSVDRAEIHAASERRSLLEPLRALVGNHFRGRTEELATVYNHLLGLGPGHLLLVQGPGGAGKSSLVGKVLLDLEREASFGLPVSFAYLDFDKARNDPHDPIVLVEQVARQLRLLYATAAEASQFAAVEAIGAGTDRERAAEILEIDQGLPLPELVRALADRLQHVQREYAPPGRVSLVLVLDTFEEVQLKGPGAVQSVVDLLQRLWAALPDMRVIVSGRAVAREFETAAGPVSLVRLEDLDPEAAEAVLKTLGVAEPELRRQIVQRYGGNPLTLRLAAESVVRTGTADGPVDGVGAGAEALAKVSIEQVQGMLYSRILGHIGDPDVVKVAHPGLAVRRVTVEVLREVLAKPCGFDPERAEDIFGRLRADVAMFDLEDPDTLRHRQDVRRLMLRTMLDEPRREQVVAEIHRRAVAFYAPRKGPTARAEELYHRLMAGEDPRSLGHLWDPELKGPLASAMEEPLPARARDWLGRRLGLVSSEDERAAWEQDDWEADAASRAASWLASNDPRGCLSVLAERSQRRQGSRLYALEVAARTALGDLDGAADVLERGLASAIESGERAAQLELLEQAIPLRAQKGDGGGVAEAARSIVALTDLTGERARGLQALTDAVAALQEHGLDGEAASLNAEISRRFSRLSRADMRRRPELIRRVLHTTGAADSGVLLHAAVQVGDLTRERDGVFVEDSFALRRLLEQTSSGARPAMAALADEVGLAGRGWSTAELASRAVRVGRTGKAVALGLDYASDDRAARQLVVNDLLRPVKPPS